MIRCLFYIFAVSSPLLIFAQSNYLNVSIGVQSYEQLANFSKFSASIAGNRPIITEQNTIRGGRPIFGGQYQIYRKDGKTLKFGVQYAANTYTFDAITFKIDQEGRVTFDAKNKGESIQTRFAQAAFDYGIPLLRNGRNWQFYAQGRVAAQYESSFQESEMTNILPRSNQFTGLALALSPELTYTFPNEKWHIGLNTVIQILRGGFDSVEVNDPILNNNQSNITGTNLTIFGKQPFQLDFQVGFLL